MTSSEVLLPFDSVVRAQDHRIRTSESKAKNRDQTVSEIKFSSEISSLTREAFIARVDEAIAREGLGDRQRFSDAGSGQS
jgi:hypothetical protein